MFNSTDEYEELMPRVKVKYKPTGIGVLREGYTKSPGVRFRVEKRNIDHTFNMGINDFVPIATPKRTNLMTPKFVPLPNFLCLHDHLNFLLLEIYLQLGNINLQ